MTPFLGGGYFRLFDYEMRRLSTLRLLPLKQGLYFPFETIWKVQKGGKEVYGLSLYEP